MKKLVVLLICFVLSFSTAAIAESSPETVAEMTYIVKMPDVIREGKYTGQIVNGVPHGYGVFVTKNSEGIQWHYLGEWENGLMAGNGGCYWDAGQSQVGTYENNEMVCGTVYTSTSSYSWFDTRNTQHGGYHTKVFRADGSIIFDGWIDPVTRKYLGGTVYKKNGDVFFSGDFGEGFDWDLIYVD